MCSRASSPSAAAACSHPTRCRPRSGSCRRSRSPHPENWCDPLRNVIVTGASRGLGLAITDALAASGYRVLGIARSMSAELQALMTAAAQAGRGTVQFYAFDLLEIAAMPQLVTRLRQEVGALYGLVNNAGLGMAGVLAMM